MWLGEGLCSTWHLQRTTHLTKAQEDLPMSYWSHATVSAQQCCHSNLALCNVHVLLAWQARSLSSSTPACPGWSIIKRLIETHCACRPAVASFVESAEATRLIISVNGCNLEAVSDDPCVDAAKQGSV